MSAVVPVAHRAIFNLGLPCGELVNRHNPPLARHAAKGMRATGWGNDCIQFKLSEWQRVTV